MKVEAKRTQVEDPITGEKLEVFEAIVPTALQESEGVLPVAAGGLVCITYRDAVQERPLNRLRRSYVAFASNAKLDITQKNYLDTLETLRVGESVFIKIGDPDRDVSYEADSVLVEATSSVGDSLVCLLSETGFRSGEFHGRIQTGAGKVDPNDAILQCIYGGKMTVQYKDYITLPREQRLEKPGGRRGTGTGEEEEVKSCVELSVSRDKRGIRMAKAVVSLLAGSDGDVKLFARVLKRGRLEKETLFSTGYCYYMLGRSFTKLGSARRAEEMFARAREEFGRLIRTYPEHKEVAHSTFYLGNIEFVRKSYFPAIQYYREVIDKWPRSEFVPQVRLRMGSAYEKLGKTEDAIDQYAYLAFHHKDSPYVADAMVNMVEYFDRLGVKANEEADEDARDLAFGRLVSIAQRFSEKFPDDPRTAKLILKAGLRLISLERYKEAAELFEEAETAHADSKYMPAFLYWHAEAIVQGNVGKESTEHAIVILKRVVYDFDSQRYTRAAKARLSTLEK